VWRALLSSASCRDLVHAALWTAVISLLPACRQPVSFICPSTAVGVLLRGFPLPPSGCTSATARRRRCGLRTPRAASRCVVETSRTAVDSCPPRYCCMPVTAGRAVQTSSTSVPRRCRSVHVIQSTAHISRTEPVQSSSLIQMKCQTAT